MSFSTAGNTRRGSWFSFMNGSIDNKSVKSKNRGSDSQTSAAIIQKSIPFFSKRRSFIVRDVRHVAGNSIPTSEPMYDPPIPSPLRKTTEEKQNWLRIRGKHKSEILVDYGTDNHDAHYSSSSDSTIASSETLSVSAPTLHMAAQYNCKICTDLKAVPNKMLECGHLFHDNCIRGWDGQCPTSFPIPFNYEVPQITALTSIAEATLLKLAPPMTGLPARFTCILK
ncbi:hypothetical protein BX666DRAFT_2025239 [Dichotomocladium elegans]|nr:hypothetical protein BX666DRAFT_2025239 [Dichotomocladium elegans]